MAWKMQRVRAYVNFLGHPIENEQSNQFFHTGEFLSFTSGLIPRLTCSRLNGRPIFLVA